MEIPTADDIAAAAALTAGEARGRLLERAEIIASLQEDANRWESCGKPKQHALTVARHLRKAAQHIAER
jgi:hypothetical protein